MVDNTNPTSQFHPYQPESSTPQTGSGTSTGFGGILGKLGIDSSKIGALRGGLGGGLNSGLGKVRSTAQTNPGMVLGGLAALAIGAGLLRRRSMIR